MNWAVVIMIVRLVLPLGLILLVFIVCRKEARMHSSPSIQELLAAAPELGEYSNPAGDKRTLVSRNVHRPSRAKSRYLELTWIDHATGKTWESSLVEWERWTSRRRETVRIEA